MQVRGILTNITPWKNGTNARGEWSVQNLDLQFDGRKTTVAVWSRPDLSSVKGKLITLDGVEEGKKGLELRADKGSIDVTDNPSSPAKPVPPVATGPSSVPSQYVKTVKTVVDVEEVAYRVIRFVYASFNNVTAGGPSPDHQAVATIVAPFIYGYLRGDFEVPSKTVVQTPQGPVEVDPNIPF